MQCGARRWLPVYQPVPIKLFLMIYFVIRPIVLSIGQIYQIMLRQN